MTVVSAPPGSGKTVLLRSWITEADLADSVAWVSVGGDERDPQRFWLSVLGALRQTTAGSALVRELTAAPDLDGWTIAERLLKDLVPLQDRIWLVFDDLHELGSGEALHQLELLVMRAPQVLRFVLATRHDLRLGLHRLRLEGELTEIREPDLRFTVDEARKLVSAAGVELPEPTLALLHERTEGWAAGLRLAALSLAGHPDPGRFAEEFSGSERTVAEYLVAEVLDRQSGAARRLLLRTSVLELVSGPLADALTGGSGGERILQELEEANAFVVALDAARSWFRYHHLFADLLQLELRRTAPGEVTALHEAASSWFAGHGHPVEAVRHAQAAQDWSLASRLLADHWPGLQLGGQAATVHELLAGFPAEAAATYAELAVLIAADELAQGSLEAAERYLGLAARALATVPADRHEQLQVLREMVRLLLARQRGNPPAVAEEARRLQAIAEAPDTALPGLGEELRGLALISLGITEVWAAQFEVAERHLEHGVALARRIGRPFLEFSGLAHQAVIETYRSFAQAAERSRQAIELAERHGWTDEPTAGTAYVMLGAAAGLAGAGRGGRTLGGACRAHRKSGNRASGGNGGPPCPRCAGAGAWPVSGCAGRFPGRRAAGREPHSAALARPAHKGIAAARPGASRRDRGCREGHRRTPRTRPRTRGDADRPGGSAARPRRSPRGDRRARTGPGRLGSPDPADVARRGFLAGGDRPGRARRPSRRRAGPGVRARSG